jgi:hypothetical protein
MAGSNAAFNPDEFRAAIRQAMVMGQPTNPAEQTTFVWLEEDTFAAEGPGPETDPYDWTATPTTTVSTRKVVQVNCAVEFQRSEVAGEPAGSMGGFSSSYATLTLLDEDWALVKGADEVLIGGNTYLIEAPGATPMGLFDVGVYQLRVTARA